MKIRDMIGQGKPTLSFEVFPPKTEANYESVEKAALEIGKLHPSFMSVTYGAGGGTSKYTVSIADKIQRECGVPTLAHLTCVSSTREHVHKNITLRILWRSGGISQRMGISRMTTAMRPS